MPKAHIPKPPPANRSSKQSSSPPTDDGSTPLESLEPSGSRASTSLRRSPCGGAGSALREKGVPLTGCSDNLTRRIGLRFLSKRRRRYALQEYKARSNGTSGTSAGSFGGLCSMKYSSYLNDEPMPDAASEKEQGNEYFKQKKFAEAIECYSRSIGLSPTAVAFANRAMAYLKLRRFKEAEDDCTEALNLDDRYIKAYSRRITARKELGKFKEAMDDAEFAISLEPTNPELRKQYSEIKALHTEKLAKKTQVPAKRAVCGFDKPADKKEITSHPPTISQKSRNANQKPGPEASIQELASRAASRYMASTAKSVKIPKTAYDFEVSWRALSDDTAQQIQLLKSIPPASLPEIFKNALSAPFLIDIVKCSASIFRDDAALAVSILENLAKVPRFDLIIMCLSSMHKSELRKIWDQVFFAEKASADQVEVLRQLRGRYIQGGWQDNMFTSS
ncbi:RNA polymerase II-associated protein 3-like isoform X3 [Panicum virgatum]|uniref:RNA polymerase II-associated protein 3-like isoform X3 n=1 Tax=Panicum virgatum TaxID=38727 RepID=UPI0019D55A5D|nr:RNA polymerase II-associated protein 3-like isoform X3 [Panicum virgatum]